MNPEILLAVKTSPELPSMPSVAVRVVEMTQTDDVDVKELADLVATDPALVTKILKTVNSPFYGLGKEVGTIRQALIVLGLQAVKTLVLGFSLVRNIRKYAETNAHFDYETFWHRSLYAAVATKQIGRHINLLQSEEAFLAALLQDLGMPVLHTVLGDAYDRVLQAAGPCHHDLPATESRMIDATHAEVASLLVRDWQLPPVLSTPITNHHDPQNASEDVRVLTRAVHLGGLCAETFMEHVTPEIIDLAQRTAQSMFGLDERDFRTLMDNINDGARDAAKLFELKLEGPRSYDEIMAKANEVLMTMSLKSQRQATQAESRAKEFEHQANTDPLTQVANRHKFGVELKRAFNRARKFKRVLSMIIMDGDWFKQVNDTHGHDAGDAVLVHLASTLREIERTGDVVARYGGEEFAVVLPETDANMAQSLAESIRIAVAAEPVVYENRTIPVTVSVGVATYAPDRPFSDAKAFFKAADAAVYRAKGAGRNRVEVAHLPTGTAA